MRMIPAGWFLLTIAAMLLADKYIPVVEFVLPMARIAGNVLMGLGVVIFVSSAWQFHRRKTTVHPFGEATALITDGPFRISRNPIYLAMALALCSGALQMGSATPWLFIAAFVWVIQTRQIAHEERLLAAKFDDAYADYCRRVRRWI